MILSPFPSRSLETRLPLTSVPFVEPRSAIQKSPSVTLISACLREMLGSSRIGTSHSFVRPTTATPSANSNRRSPLDEHGARSGGRDDRRRNDARHVGRLRLEHAGPAWIDDGTGAGSGAGGTGAGVRGTGAGGGGPASTGGGATGPRRELRRLDESRGDPELAHREILVLFEEDARRREQRVALAPSVLGEVVAQLDEQRRLIPAELLAITRRQVEHVLVRDVDARDRDRPMVVHLLDELACDLDGLDVRAEGAAEHPLEEGLDPVLDAAKHAQRASLYGRVLTPP